MPELSHQELGICAEFLSLSWSNPFGKMSYSF